MTKNQQAMKNISPTARTTDQLPGLKASMYRRINRREGYLGHLKQLNADRCRRRDERRAAARIAREAAAKKAADAKKKLFQDILVSA